MKDTLKLSHLFSLALVIVAAVIAQWIETPERSRSALERVRDGGVVLAGYALEPPFVTLEADGRVSGEAPEVFRRAVAAVGPGQIDWVHSDFGSLAHELASGRIDVIVSGMFITPEREGQMVFTRPTAVVCPAFAVPAGNPQGVHSYTEVADRSELRLGVVAGAVEVAQARGLGVPAERTVAFPDALSGLAAVESGRVSAFALSAVSLRRAIVEHPLLQMVAPLVGDPPVLPGRPAFALRPGDRDFRDALDHVLDGFLGSPEHHALVVPFGFLPTELPHYERSARCGQ